MEIKYKNTKIRPKSLEMGYKAREAAAVYRTTA
jgi:hypothetical protein